MAKPPIKKCECGKVFTDRTKCGQCQKCKARKVA